MPDAELVKLVYQGSNIFIHYIPFQTTPKGTEINYKASRMVRILLLVSAYSSSASESATTPHPA